MSDVGSVDEYIGAQPKAVQSVLRRVRSAIRKAIPNADELLSYGMPTYKLGKARVLYFAAWRAHYALYGATSDLLKALKAELARYKVEKGTIAFPFSEPVPVRLIERIAQLRADAVEKPKRDRR